MLARILTTVASPQGLISPAAVAAGNLSRRWLRRAMTKQGKPPNLPPSKKVLFRVVDAPWQRPDFVRELLWRRHVYNNAIQSMREVFRQELQTVQGVNLQLAEVKRLEEEEFNDILAKNEERNKQKAEEREQQLKSKLEETREMTLMKLEQMRLEESAEVARKTWEVEKMIALSSNFITAENLEQKIEEALENPVVYEYALDLEGKKFLSPLPVKFLEGVPTAQRGRIFDQSGFRDLSSRVAKASRKRRAVGSES